MKTGLTTPVDITLTGSDPDGDPLTFIVITQPEFGSVSEVSGTPPQVTYTPAGVGVTDSFAFRVFDGISDSPPALVSIELTSGGAAEDPPPNFTDVAPPNKIDDALDDAIALAPSSSFDVVVIFTGAFMDQVVDEAALGDLVGGLLNDVVSITAITSAVNAASMTLTGTQINTLAEFNDVIRIEEDTVFSFPPFGG